MSFIYSGVVLPPEISNGLLLFGGAILTAITGIVIAAGFYIRSYIKSQADKTTANTTIEIDKLKREAENNARESANNADAVKLAIEIARTTTSRLDKAEATIASQDKQLAESRTNSIERDRKIGELQAMLSKTASERDQEVQQRKEVEKQRDNAIAEREVMKQQIADLKAKAAEFDKLSARVEELEKRQQERHDAINRLQEKLGEIELRAIAAEKERDQFKKDNDQLKAELELERRKSQQIATPVEIKPATEGGVA